MRILLIDWLSAISHDFEMNRNTFHKSVYLLDKFLTLIQIPKDKLQLYGAVSLSLSSKIEEVYCPYFKDFVIAGANSFYKGILYYFILKR